MADASTTQLIAAVLSGGAMGAIINAGVASYRGRRQPVGYRTNMIPVFQHAPEENRLAATVTVGTGADQVQFKNLYIAEIDLVNRGNNDVAEFPFGVTLSEGDKAVYAELCPPDRHHSGTLPALLDPKDPRAEIDFVLKPFNRGDSYTLKLYVVVPEGHPRPGEIDLSSPMPVSFSAIPPFRDVLLQAALESVKATSQLTVKF